MCCFSQPIDSVSSTKIFARRSAKGRQVLVYSMDLETAADVAMVLPLPVSRKDPDDKLGFINLEEYEDFFLDLAKGFRGRSRELSLGGLEVVEVGSFVASFVPTTADFGRLDPRFQLPPGTLEALPKVKDYGFAVFQLKPGAKTIHPMAFDFPCALEKSLFFPTLHIHDGKVHEEAEFDHVLYCQPGELSLRELVQWKESGGPASQFMKLEQAKELVDGEQHLYRLELKGKKRNQDTLVA